MPPSSKQSRQQARDKLAQLRAEQARQERRRTLAIFGGIAVVLALVVAGATWAIISNRHTSHDSADSVPGVRSFEVASRDHVTTKVDYPQTPPVGGDHNPTWLNCGYYGQPVPSENAVHDMEHGAVWITYQPTLPAAEVAHLRKLAQEQDFVTISPFPGLPSPIVASAWGKQLRLTNVNDSGLEKFIGAYRLGPQTPELGAPCTGGVGQPTG